MAAFGYSLLSEQSGPQQLVADAALAEEAGFDFATLSDHYSPWLEEQGHSPYAWSVLGAIAQVTERMDLVSLVTCPTGRYHPAVVAQKAATMGLLSEGRFTLGIGAGENLNEHVVGAWPRTEERHDALNEALEIIRSLLGGDTLTYSGNHFEVSDARVYDLPPEPVPVAVAMSGPTSAKLAGEHGDAMVAVQPRPEYVQLFDAAGGSGKPRYGQVSVCYGPDEGTCRRIAHEQNRFNALGWKVMAELPNPEAFAAATQYVRPEDVAQTVPCGPDLGQHVSAIRDFVDAGFTHVAIVQVGGENQHRFLHWAERELLPALRGG
jgi:G6PDH family F420-dependent oxidoreductase